MYTTSTMGYAELCRHYMYNVMHVVAIQAQRDIVQSTSQLTRLVDLKKWPRPTLGRMLKLVASWQGNWCAQIILSTFTYMYLLFCQ